MPPQQNLGGSCTFCLRSPSFTAMDCCLPMASLDSFLNNGSAVLEAMS